MPSEYLFDNVYVTTQPMEFISIKSRSHARHLLELCHADEMFMHSSNWPHHSVNPVDWLFDLPISDETRDRIAHGNAESVFRFPE